jgi:SagB-type dehydrogenase family enzyme
MLLDLPAPRLTGARSLEDVVRRRRSVREFRPDPLTPEEISQLLWATQGITGEQGYRAAPSAGALYPLELYVATAHGLFHHEVSSHALRRVIDADPRVAMRRASVDQSCVTSAPAVFVFTAVYARTCDEYGGRGRMYVHMDVGHAAQNLLLQADALDLAGVPLGAFEPPELKTVLGLPADEEPVYLVPIGHPA